MQKKKKESDILEDIQSKVSERLNKYDDLNTLEQYSLFMGTVQFLEIGLKNLLVRKYDYEFEKIENYTLGRLKNELEKSGLRSDFLILLDSVIDYRNYIAHDFLADNAMLQSILKGKNTRLASKHFHKGIFELVQLVLIFEWCEEKDAWD